MVTNPEARKVLGNFPEISITVTLSLYDYHLGVTKEIPSLYFQAEMLKYALDQSEITKAVFLN